MIYTFDMIYTKNYTILLKKKIMQDIHTSLYLRKDYSPEKSSLNHSYFSF